MIHSIQLFPHSFIRFLYFHLVKEHLRNGMVFTVEVGVDLLWSDTIYDQL